MFNRSEKQKQLFDTWAFECKKLSYLNTVIQNDFCRLVADGYIDSPAQVKESFEEFNDLFNKNIFSLNQLKNEIDLLGSLVMEELTSVSSATMEK